MSQIKNGGLDQYGDDPFEQQQFGTAGVEWVTCNDADDKLFHRPIVNKHHLLQRF